MEKSNEQQKDADEQSLVQQLQQELEQKTQELADEKEKVALAAAAEEAKKVEQRAYWKEKKQESRLRLTNGSDGDKKKQESRLRLTNGSDSDNEAKAMSTMLSLSNTWTGKLGNAIDHLGKYCNRNNQVPSTPQQQDTLSNTTVVESSTVDFAGATNEESTAASVADSLVSTPTGPHAGVKGTSTTTTTSNDNNDDNNNSNSNNNNNNNNNSSSSSNHFKTPCALVLRKEKVDLVDTISRKRVPPRNSATTRDTKKYRAENPTRSAKKAQSVRGALSLNAFAAEHGPEYLHGKKCTHIRPGVNRIMRSTAASLTFRLESTQDVDEAKSIGMEAVKEVIRLKQELAEKDSKYQSAVKNYRLMEDDRNNKHVQIQGLRAQLEETARTESPR